MGHIQPPRGLTTAQSVFFSLAFVKNDLFLLLGASMNDGFHCGVFVSLEVYTHIPPEWGGLGIGMPV